MPLPYTIREGLAGFARTRFAAFTSTSALVLALALIGLVVLLAWQGRRVAEAVQARIGEVQVYLAPADTAAVGLLRRRFEAMPGVEDVSFVSQQEAARIFRDEFGDEAELFDESLFLPASFRVRFHSPYTSPDSLAALKEVVERWPAVDDVIYEQTLLENVTRNVRLYSLVGLGLGAIVVLAALLLVANTVRLSIYARRLLIRTMKLVGATDSFVRRPFLVEGLVQGVVAGVIAAILLAVLYASLARAVEGLDRAGWPGGSPLPTMVGVVVLGGVLGLLASWVAVRTFLKRVRLS